jgi:hypothetical protein
VSPDRVEIIAAETLAALAELTGVSADITCPDLTAGGALGLPLGAVGTVIVASGCGATAGFAADCAASEGSALDGSSNSVNSRVTVDPAQVERSKSFAYGSFTAFKVVKRNSRAAPVPLKSSRALVM